MKADLQKRGDVFVISIAGKLEIEQTQPFRTACVDKLIGQKIVFNMEQANFVGSTGLQPFLDTISQIDQKNTFGLKIVGVKAEFRRVISNLETKNVSFHDDMVSAIGSFTLPITDTGNEII